jgi:hypothetical protein
MIKKKEIFSLNMMLKCVPRFLREFFFSVFRSFYYSNNDEEITYCLPSNTLLVAYSSFITQNKSKKIYKF